MSTNNLNSQANTYNYDKQPTAMVFTGASTANESYTYDADGERVVRSVATGIATYYIGGGIYEEGMPNGITSSMYSLNGQVVAQRMVNPSLFAPIITYLHSDHLGSVSVATDTSGNPVSSQEYDPWGAVISGGVSQTAINYTGQRLDATGLLYYHARYYDPSLGKFLTPDSIVPGPSIGAGGALGTGVGVGIGFGWPCCAAQGCDDRPRAKMANTRAKVGISVRENFTMNLQ